MSVNMGKWTSRRKRRARVSDKKLKFFFWILVAVAAFILPELLLAGQPAFFQPDERQKAGPVSAWPRLLQRMLAENISGMEQPALAENYEIREVALNVLYTLTGIDPRDPRSILERELGVGTLFALPALRPPEGSRPGADKSDETPKTPEEPEAQTPVFNPRFPFLGYSEPVGLVYHSHITESFEPSFGVRFSENLDQTVARLGDELVRLLQEQYGLPLLHHRGIYDLPRITAYQKARPVVQQILVENPQLDMVIDLHRDGVRRELTTAMISGVETGKILIVIGTRKPGWESNLAFALCLHRELETVAPGISRGVRRQNYSYNQDLHPRAVLIEVGGHENTMEEAMRSVHYLAEALARSYYHLFAQN